MMRSLLSAIALMLTAAALLLAAAPCGAEPLPAPPAEVRALAGLHPAEYYRRAARLLADGRKDDATFVFYLGQLRYRTHLMARPGLKPDGDPALFASLSQVVGRPINEHAFGDIPALARIIDAVLAYDGSNPDTFTSPKEFPKQTASIRAGLVEMRSKLLMDADQIRATRLKNGLQNRN